MRVRQHGQLVLMTAYNSTPPSHCHPVPLFLAHPGPHNGNFLAWPHAQCPMLVITTNALCQSQTLTIWYCEAE